jgi:hypothetical protein
MIRNVKPLGSDIKAVETNSWLEMHREAHQLEKKGYISLAPYTVTKLKDCVVYYQEFAKKELVKEDGINGTK